MSRYNNGASLTDLKKLRNATGRYKNNVQQQREVATVNNGGRVVAAEGWVVLGRGQLQPTGSEAAPVRPD